MPWNQSGNVQYSSWFHDTTLGTTSVPWVLPRQRVDYIVKEFGHHIAICDRTLFYTTFVTTAMADAIVCIISTMMIVDSFSSTHYLCGASFPCGFLHLSTDTLVPFHIKFWVTFVVGSSIIFSFPTSNFSFKKNFSTVHFRM